MAYNILRRRQGIRISIRLHALQQPEIRLLCIDIDENRLIKPVRYIFRISNRV